MFDDLVHLAEASANRFALRPLFGERHDGEWRWITYAEVFRAVDEIRGGLADLGVGPGDRVAIVSRNSAMWAAAAYATYGLGATFVPMYELQRPEDWEFILRDCTAKVVFGRTPEIVGALDAMRPRLQALQHVIAIEGHADDLRSLTSLRERGRVNPRSVAYPAPDDLAGLIYTSGTTGAPKGVMLSHKNLASNVGASTSIFPITADDRSLAFLPWAHAYGQTVELHILVSVGASTAFNDDKSRLLDDLHDVRPTMLVAVPRIFNKIHTGLLTQMASKPHVIQSLFHAGLAAATLRARGERLTVGQRAVHWLADRLIFAKIRARFGGRLKWAICGAGALAPEVGQFIDALGIEVYEGYGLTEAAPIVSGNRPGDRKMTSSGRVLPGVTIRIDETLGDRPGEGEIIVYGPNVMKGYHARPDENAKVFTPDGGLRTGDLGHVDSDGFLFITGRIKEQFKLDNGEYVMPAPLEEQFELSPYILNAFVYGANRPYNVAVLVLDVPQVRAWAARNHKTLGDDLTRDPAVAELIASEVAAHSTSLRSLERVRDFVLTTEEFTPDNDLLTPTLKLKRRNIIARYGTAIEELYRTPAHAPPLAAREPAPPAELRH
jgi:long-chain acyl-CoA synthetase